MYYEIKPSNKLSKYVESFWINENVKEDNTSIIEPDACFDIVVYIYEDKNKVLLTGIWDRPVEVSTYKDVDVFGVRFFPKSLEVFFDMSLSELKNTNIEIEDINFRKNIDIDLLKYSKDVKEMISFFEIILEELMTDEYSIISKLMNEIDLKNPVSEISNNIGISRRHLSRVTKDKLGVTPKAYINIVRFIKAKEMLVDGASLLDIVFECGYYDQSHFTKEFKKYTGKTPAEY